MVCVDGESPAVKVGIEDLGRKDDCICLFFHCSPLSLTVGEVFRCVRDDHFIRTVFGRFPHLGQHRSDSVRRGICVDLEFLCEVGVRQDGCR